MKRYDQRICGNEVIDKPNIHVKKYKKELFDIEKALNSIEHTKMFGNVDGRLSEDKI